MRLQLVVFCAFMSPQEIHKLKTNVILFCVTDVALDREVEGDLVLGDMGHGMPFRPGTFDGCVR